MDSQRAVAKRVFDVIVGSVLLVAFAPLMAVIAVAIRLDSPGPALFRQRRVGGLRADGGGWAPGTFEIFKFRSMYHGADESRHREYIAAFVDGSIDEAEAAQGHFKLAGDDRVTRVGRVIRRTSFDELPQLFNVVRGEMSLVGPRPVPVYEVDGYDESHLERFGAPSGMTGLWQVRGRGRVTFEEMIDMDVEYVRRRNMWLDVLLLLETVPAAFSGRGAG